MAKDLNQSGVIFGAFVQPPSQHMTYGNQILSMPFHASTPIRTFQTSGTLDLPPYRLGEKNA